MSTFLEICNEVNRVIGVQGFITDVTSPKGIHRNIVEAVASSWVDIQTSKTDWPWMINELSSFNTVEDKVIYTPLEVFGSSVAAANLSVYNQSRGFFLEGRPLGYVRWEDLPYALNTVKAQPTWVSIDSYTNNLHFERPDGPYNIIIRYKRNPQLLLVNEDTPFISAQFHPLIRYRAIANVSTYIGNIGLLQQYTLKADVMQGQLMREFVPVRTIRRSNFVI